jgi:alpha-mannosidase
VAVVLTGLASTLGRQATTGRLATAGFRGHSANQRVNLRLRRAAGTRVLPPIVAIDDGGTGAVVVEAVKAADNRSGDLVLRLYEALGGRARAVVTPGVAITAAAEADLLERPRPECPVIDFADGRFELELRPFEVRTLILRRRPSP